MKDSAQDLEQLIHQYTQELLRFQKQYAAHMPTANEPDAITAAVEPEPAVDPPLQAPLEPEPMEEAMENLQMPEGETDGSGDRPLLLQDDDGRYPRFARNDNLQSGSEEEPDIPEGLPDESESVPMGEPEPSDNPSANRDLMSDPDAVTPQAFPPELTPAPSTPELTDFGQLQVQVFKAGEAIPIENATVTIFQEEPDGSLTPVTVTRTNRSGFTPAITVPTVSATLSLEPGHEHPYSTYVVQVNVPGYFTIEDIHVPVYGGITSVQPAEMLPLPENYRGDTTVTYPESEPNL